jgi:hypothetical protein
MLLDGVFGHAFPRDAAEVFWGSLSDMITTFPRDAATPLWKKNKKQKWTIGLRRPHNFAAGFAFVQKMINSFVVFFGENGRLA